MNADIALALVVAGLGLALYFTAVTYAIVQVVRTPDLSTVDRGIWTAAIVIVPVAAMLVWYVLGPHPFGLRAGTPTFR